MKRESMVEIIAGLFIMLFIYACSSKLLDFEKFIVDLGKSPLLTAFPGPVAILIPTIEIFISILLVIPKWRLYGFYLATSLMMVFTLYIIAVMKLADYTPCSCGGILQHMSWNTHILFNLAFVVFGILAVLVYPYKNAHQFN